MSSRTARTPPTVAMYDNLIARWANTAAKSAPERTVRTGDKASVKPAATPKTPAAPQAATRPVWRRSPDKRSISHI